MRILVCGGRDYKAVAHVYATLDALRAELGDFELIHGAAPGADTLAGLWAACHGVPCKAIPAEWGKYGKRAGYLRNVAMADLGPALVVAFPGGRGTAMMCEIAAQRGIPVRRAD